jgi:carbonic anhydrase
MTCCAWRRIALSVSVFMIAAAAPAEDPPAGHHSWDYGREHGPAHWGDLSPEFAACKTGRHQSPIDVRQTVKADLPAIGFAYRPSRLRIVDNGHTVMATWDPGSSIQVGRRRYELKQLHFHRPSENTVLGRRFEMEAHLVHADAAGAQAVVAVLLEAGQENALVRELWNDLPREKGHEDVRDDVRVDASLLLPSARGYYTFEGSLTTPPCSESVTWIVLKQPVQVSAAEVAQFAKLYPNDARPAQPLHGRVVRESN